MTLRPPALAVAVLALAAASPALAQAPEADLASELQACVDAPETEAEAETGLMTCSRALEAAENDLDRAGVHVKIANLWLALGDTNAAISAVDRGAELAPEGEAQLYQAAVRYRAGLYDEALAMAEAGLRDRPDDPHLTRLRLLALTDARRHEEARAGLERLFVTTGVGQREQAQACEVRVVRPIAQTSFGLGQSLII